MKCLGCAAEVSVYGDWCTYKCKLANMPAPAQPTSELLKTTSISSSASGSSAEMPSESQLRVGRKIRILDWLQFGTGMDDDVAEMTLKHMADLDAWLQEAQARLEEAKAKLKAVASVSEDHLREAQARISELEAALEKIAAQRPDAVDKEHAEAQRDHSALIARAALKGTKQ